MQNEEEAWIVISNRAPISQCPSRRPRSWGLVQPRNWWSSQTAPGEASPGIEYLVLSSRGPPSQIPTRRLARSRSWTRWPTRDGLKFPALLISYAAISTDRVARESMGNELALSLLSHRWIVHSYSKQLVSNEFHILSEYISIKRWTAFTLIVKKLISNTLVLTSSVLTSLFNKTWSLISELWSLIF